MRKKYSLWYEFANTEDEANSIISNVLHNEDYKSPYVRDKYPPHYTPWDSANGKEHKFIVWYARS